MKFVGSRCSVKLPLKIDTDILPDNYSIAKSRLRNLKSRLDKNPVLMKFYNNIINDYFNGGIIEPVNDSDTFGTIQYLSHRPVAREERNITKVGIVYDASAKTSGQFSLIDTIHSSPCLLPIILAIFLRFRLGQVALVVDIRQVFLQIEIDNLHRVYLRFVWYENMENLNLINIYRFTRLVSGLTCSPFILNSTVKIHVQNYINDKTIQILTVFTRPAIIFIIF